MSQHVVNSNLAIVVSFTSNENHHVSGDVVQLLLPEFMKDLNLDLDSLFNGFGFGLGFENSNGGPPLSLPLLTNVS